MVKFTGHKKKIIKIVHQRLSQEWQELPKMFVILHIKAKILIFEV